MRKSLSFFIVASIALTPATLVADNAASTNLGEYKEVQCSTRSEFKTNSCNQCFEARKKVEVGKQITGIFDNWDNNTKNIFTAYKSDQKTPYMVSIAGSTWKTSPSIESKAWVYDSDVVWKPAPKGDNYILTAGQKIRFWKTDLGAGYTLTNTNKKGNDLVGILKFPIVYRETSLSDGQESDSKTHTECVAYSLNKAPEIKPNTPNTKNPSTVTPVKKTPTKPIPKETTKVESGPAQTLLLIIAAFFIAFGLMISLRKKA